MQTWYGAECAVATVATTVASRYPLAILNSGTTSRIEYAQLHYEMGRPADGNACYRRAAELSGIAAVPPPEHHPAEPFRAQYA